ncbi:hypothetical protein BO94DRAFT_132444 [Aspergillus sclerotioniger CBS 115572]|uniref:Uncharacterized protein n=1 Tax=Aspergillus sclerotioniger CBS 115572 TaxID=1450535 RepID=A0A317XAX1_9EURO|nr:hypothetical protein BO94DRAFT_132444 [Aspergillus sclerotioniger CBS 115572]PWY95649.1 hypothetical protein BO94DRAFT_132444 [Aspergillus sclerotioniger CBS 115572]
MAQCQPHLEWLVLLQTSCRIFLNGVTAVTPTFYYIIMLMVYIMTSPSPSSCLPRPSLSDVRCLLSSRGSTKGLLTCDDVREARRHDMSRHMHLHILKAMTLERGLEVSFTNPSYDPPDMGPIWLLSPGANTSKALRCFRRVSPNARSSRRSIVFCI